LSWPVFEAEITFRTQQEVGRANPLVLNHPTARYRPHVTLNTSLSPYHVPSSERLGSQFPRQGKDLQAGVPTLLRFEALYSDVDYSGLRPGARFRILEGPLLVGTGRIVRILQEKR
jgi:hypothetical protein